MPLFIEHLYEQENRWAIQVIQHAMSLHAHVPVRLLEKDRIFLNVPNEYRHAVEEAWHNRTFLKGIPNHIVRHFNNGHNSPWLTRASNPHPLVRHLRRNLNWIATEQVCISAWLENASKEGKKDQQKVNEGVVGPADYYSHEMKVCAFRLDVGSFKGFVVVGPTFHEPEDDSEEGFWNDSVKTFLERIRKDAQGSANLDDFDMLDLIQYGTARPGINDRHLIEKTKMLGYAFRTLFRMEFDPRYTDDLQRHTFNSLAQITFLINRSDVRKTLRNLREKCKKPVCFRLVQQDPKHPLFAVLSGKNLKAVPREEIGDFDEDLCIPSRNADLTDRTSSYAIGALIRDLNICRRDLQISYGSLHQGHANDRLTRFEKWLGSQYGVVSAPGVYKREEEPYSSAGDQQADGQRGDGTFQRLYWRIARTVAHQFTADVSTLYVLERGKDEDSSEKGILEPRVVQFQGPYDHAKTTEWQHALRKIMDRAGRDESERKLAICYRCIDTGRPQFCRAWDPHRKEAIPSSQMLLANLPGKPRRSAMAVPLMVFGRAFGVLEIAGFSPNQFRRANLDLATRMGSTLSSFLYEKEVLFQLGSLSKITSDQRVPDDKKYKEICKRFAQIFLADASSLYMPKSGHRDVYEQVAWFNRPDLDRVKKLEGPFTMEFSRDDSYLAEALLESDNSYRRFNLKRWAHPHPGYTEELPQRLRLVEAFGWAAVIPLRNPEKTTELLCGLVLYYKSNDDSEDMPQPSDRWKPTIEYMSYHMALMVAAAQSSAKREAKLRHILSHEIKQNVDSICSRAQSIRDIAGPLLKEDLGDRRRLWVKYQDLESYRMSLIKISDLLKPWNFRELLRSGLDPIVFLAERKDLRLDEVPRRLALRGMFDNLFHSIPGSARHKGLSFEFEYQGTGEIPFMVANETVAYRIFHNLFVNAAKYSHPNSQIKARIIPKRRTWEIHLLNKARCLKNKEERISIFLEGFRGSNTSEQDREGEGLGLYVIQTLCSYLGGDVEVRINPVKDGSDICEFDFVVGLPSGLFGSGRFDPSEA